MRVQLRVQIAARQVPEGRCNHAVRLHPRAAPRRRVPAPRLQQLRLDPVQRRPHRLVMRPDHPPVAMQQRRQRDRLRRRKRDVQPRTVLVLAVAQAPQADVRARHIPQQDGVEALRRDMTSEPQRLCCLPVPEARLAVLRIVLGVIPVLLEIVDRRTRRADVRYRRDHGGILVGKDRARMVVGNGESYPGRARGACSERWSLEAPVGETGRHVRRTNQLYAPPAHN